MRNLIALLLFSINILLGTDLRNMDSQKYKISITSNSGEKKTIDISGFGIIQNICTGCKIALGQQTIEAKPENVVIIKNGSLEVR